MFAISADCPQSGLNSTDCVNSRFSAGISSLGLLILTLLALFSVDVHTALAAADGDEAMITLERYIRASYARDYEEAYSYIARADKRLKVRTSYVRDRGAFTGFTLEIARRVASYIELSAVENRIDA